jgi:hypothetical protein
MLLTTFLAETDIWFNYCRSASENFSGRNRFLCKVERVDNYSTKKRFLPKKLIDEVIKPCLRQEKNYWVALGEITGQTPRSIKQRVPERVTNIAVNVFSVIGQYLSNASINFSQSATEPTFLPKNAARRG